MKTFLFGTFGTVHIAVNNKAFPSSLDITGGGIHTSYKAGFRRSHGDLLYAEDAGTGTGSLAYANGIDYRETPVSFSVVESQPDGIVKRLNNGQPAEVKEAAEKLREYAAGLYNGQGARTPELQYLTGRVCRRMRAIYRRLPHQKLVDAAEDITGEILSAGYIEALEQLASRNAGKELGYIQEVADSTGTSWPSVLLFGVRVAGDPHRYSYLGGTDRALVAYVSRERLRGIHRPAHKSQKTYKERLSSEENRFSYEAAEGMVQPWPVRIDEHGNLTEVEITCEKGKLPADFEPVRRDFYSTPVRGKPYTVGFKRLPRERSYEMVEDMATIMLQDGEQFPPSTEQRYAFDELITEANESNINPWAYVIEQLPRMARSLAPVWEESRNKLYLAALERYERMNDPVARRPRLEAWPSWEEQLCRLERISANPRLRIVYPPQVRVKRNGEKGDGSLDMEKRYGLRVPAKHTGLINTLKKNPWFAANCDVIYNDTRPYAPPDVARLSLGDEYDPGKRYEIAGSWGIDGDTGRGRMTIYRAGFNRSQTLAEEVYHAVYDIIRSTNNGYGEKVERLARKYAQSKLPDEAFAKAMAAETVSRGSSRLPKRIVTSVVDIVKGQRSIPGDALEKIKNKRGTTTSY